MKKNLFLLPLLMVGTGIFAQCNIIGKSHIGFNETAEYTVDVDAQCTDCYQWKAPSNNAVIMGNGMQKTIGLKGAGNGQTILSTTVLTPQGVSICSKVIEIVGGNNSVATSNCDVEITDFKEAKISNRVLALFPNNPSNSSYSYQWTANYSNGDIKTSNEKVPQLPYPFQSIKVKVTSKKCYKEYTKTYNDSFWKFFN